VLQGSLEVVGERGPLERRLLLEGEPALGERVLAMRAPGIVQQRQQAPAEMPVRWLYPASSSTVGTTSISSTIAGQCCPPGSPAPLMMSGSRVMHACIADGHFSISP
jgi:hypothetical protein